MINANKIAAFCATVYGKELCPLAGAYNIVYIEGMNPDGTLNDDRPNRWNDLRLLLTLKAEGWQIVHNAIATTEPGDPYTRNPINKKGCARIAFGYHPPAWKRGFHKGVQPALVQVDRVLIHRDLNRDGLRNRTEAAFWSEVRKGKNGKDIHTGINDHTTRPGFNGESIGMYSAGCQVGKSFEQHMNEFLPLLEKDSRIKHGEIYLYDKWVLPGDKFSQFVF